MNQPEVKLAIVGSRNFTDNEFFQEKINEFISTFGKPTMIISGGAKGADTLGEEYANDNGIQLIVYKPDWYPNGKYDKSAGIRRNSDIINDCTHVLAFPSHNGKGTQDSISKGKRWNKTVITFFID